MSKKGHRQLRQVKAAKSKSKCGVRSQLGEGLRKQMFLDGSWEGICVYARAYDSVGRVAYWEMMFLVVSGKEFVFRLGRIK
ncbi:unnamed protein product [Lupinus luteus]|uniref:Uncharacterized protein n=1 Tax=Lupinus luteus TaxID=3873 RepID=A0AAV1WK20_LUPLU